MGLIVLKIRNVVTDKHKEKTDAISNFAKNVRYEWLDILRGMAMFFVVLVHASYKLKNWWIYNVYIGPIMIPLFFVISGFLFKTRSGNQREFFKHLLKKLVIPWLFLSLIWLRAFLIPLKGIEYWLGHLHNVISGKSMWFMPACIIAEIIFFYTLKTFRTRCGVVVASGICVALGFTMHYFHVGNFGMFNRSLIAQFFLLLGYEIKSNKDVLLNLSSKYVFGGIGLYLLLGTLSILLFPGKYMDVHLNKYQNIVLCFGMICVGCLTLFLGFSKISKSPKKLIFFGQNTLICYAFHSYGFGCIDVLLRIVGIERFNNWVCAIIISILSSFICSLLAVLINRIVPECVGKIRRR